MCVCTTRAPKPTISNFARLAALKCTRRRRRWMLHIIESSCSTRFVVYILIHGCHTMMNRRDAHGLNISFGTNLESIWERTVHAIAHGSRAPRATKHENAGENIIIIDQMMLRAAPPPSSSRLPHNWCTRTHFMAFADTHYSRKTATHQSVRSTQNTHKHNSAPHRMESFSPHTAKHTHVICYYRSLHTAIVSDKMYEISIGREGETTRPTPSPRNCGVKVCLENHYAKTTQTNPAQTDTQECHA